MRRNKVKSYASEMRNNPTEGEESFWDLVRKRQFLGLLFNRQYVFNHVGFDQKLHYYIVDFYCHEVKLIVEIDGAYHDNPNQVELDELRTETLAQMGMSLVRFSNEEVVNNSDKVLKMLRLAVEKVDK